MDHNGGWIDFALLDYVDQLTKPSGMEFVGLSTGDQTAAVVALTPDEKARLERERPMLFDFDEAYDLGGEE